MLAGVLVASNTIGAIPLFIAYAVKSANNPEVIGKIAANPSDISVLVLIQNNWSAADVNSFCCRYSCLCSSY